MRQRAMIACALAAEPETLIADKPTTTLNLIIQKQIIDLLNSIQIKTSMGLIFITHDLAVAAQIADDIAVMQQGRIVEINHKDIIFNNPQHNYRIYTA